MQTLSISAFQSVQTLKSSSAQSWTFNTLREKTNRYNYKQSNQRQGNANGYLFNQTRSQTHTYKPSAARLQKQAKRKKRNCNNQNGSGQSITVSSGATPEILKPACCQQRALHMIIMVTQPPPNSSHLLYVQDRSVSIGERPWRSHLAMCRRSWSLLLGALLHNNYGHWTATKHLT